MVRFFYRGDRHSLRGLVLPRGVVRESYGPYKIERVKIQVAVSPRHQSIESDEHGWPITIGGTDPINIVGAQAFPALLERQVLQSRQCEEDDTDAEWE